MTDEEVGEMSFKIAKAVARKMGVRDFREIVGAVWQGVSRAAAKGIHGKMLHVAGRRGALDYFRETAPGGVSRWWSGKGVVVEQLGVIPARHVLDREAVPPPEARLGELWADTRGMRALATMRQRVAAYLHFVCGWTQRDIAAALDITQSTVANMLELFRENVANNRGA